MSVTRIFGTIIAAVCVMALVCSALVRRDYVPSTIPTPEPCPPVAIWEAFAQAEKAFYKISGEDIDPERLTCEIDDDNPRMASCWMLVSGSLIRLECNETRCTLPKCPP